MFWFNFPCRLLANVSEQSGKRAITLKPTKQTGSSYLGQPAPYQEGLGSTPGLHPNAISAGGSESGERQKECFLGQGLKN